MEHSFVTIIVLTLHLNFFKYNLLCCRLIQAMIFLVQKIKKHVLRPIIDIGCMYYQYLIYYKNIAVAIVFFHTEYMQNQRRRTLRYHQKIIICLYSDLFKKRKVPPYKGENITVYISASNNNNNNSSFLLFQSFCGLEIHHFCNQRENMQHYTLFALRRL